VFAFFCEAAFGKILSLMMAYFTLGVKKDPYRLLMDERAKRNLNLTTVNFNYIVAGDILSIAF